jgi:nicotinate-nucleotide pyrophosphorylase (carboxylating)
MKPKGYLFHSCFCVNTGKRFATSRGTLQEWAVAALDEELIQQHVQRALAEDIGAGDVTTDALLPAEATGRAVIVAREPLTICGLALAEEAFRQLAAEANLHTAIEDGNELDTGEALLEIHAPCRALLTAERTALNYLQRLSGIATQAARYVEAVSGTGVLILDTRKTTPGWRAFEKYAVQCGGARNHRRGLDDLIMIKDNHLAALPGDNPVAGAVARAHEAAPELKVEVEADTLEQAEAAAKAGANIILLDNMPPEMLREAIALIDGRSQTEASGGITLNNIRAVAETGVNYISVGALTHSAMAVDIAMDFSPTP